MIKFVFPGAGNLVSSGMAFAGTWGIGEASMAYFIDNATVDETKQKFAESKKTHEKKPE